MRTVFRVATMKAYLLSLYLKVTFLHMHKQSFTQHEKCYIMESYFNSIKSFFYFLFTSNLLTSYAPMIFWTLKNSTSFTIRSLKTKIKKRQNWQSKANTDLLKKHFEYNVYSRAWFQGFFYVKDKINRCFQRNPVPARSL